MVFVDCWAPLFCAAWSGNLNVFFSIIPDKFLLYSLLGHDKIAETLIRNGANVNIRNRIGRTPICQAKYIVIDLMSRNISIQSGVYN